MLVSQVWSSSAARKCTWLSRQNAAQPAEICRNRAISDELFFASPAVVAATLVAAVVGLGIVFPSVILIVFIFIETATTAIGGLHGSSRYHFPEKQQEMLRDICRNQIRSQPAAAWVGIPARSWPGGSSPPVQPEGRGRLPDQVIPDRVSSESAPAPGSPAEVGARP